MVKKQRYPNCPGCMKIKVEIIEPPTYTLVVYKWTKTVDGVRKDPGRIHHISEEQYKKILEMI